MTEDTEDLTRAIAAGDPAAFSRFYDRWFDHVFRDVQRSTRCDESFCLDVVQEVMMRVIRSIRPMPDDARVAAWLRVVARSCAIDRLRSEQRHRDRVRRAAATSASKRPARDDSNTYAEQLAWLEAELAELDPQSQDLLLLRHRLGWTLDRIGTALGLTPGAVDGRLRRLTRLLRRRAAEGETP